MRDWIFFKKWVQRYICDPLGNSEESPPPSYFIMQSSTYSRVPLRRQNTACDYDQDHDQDHVNPQPTVHAVSALDFERYITLGYMYLVLPLTFFLAVGVLYNLALRQPGVYVHHELTSRARVFSQASAAMRPDWPKTNSWQLGERRSGGITVRYLRARARKPTS